MANRNRQSGSVIRASVAAFDEHKRLADGAVAQMTDEQLRKTLDAHTNSIAVIMKHVAGNLTSRWGDFLTSDGEKPTRDRDGEFIDTFKDRSAIMACWEDGWKVLFDTLHGLADADLFKTVTIRGEPYHVADAIQRSLAHTAYHCGQIVIIARHLAGEKWNTLTIPRGGSKAFNQSLGFKT